MPSNDRHGRRPRSRPPLARAAIGLCATTLMVLSATVAEVAAAPLSSGIDRSSRITVGVPTGSSNAVTASAVHGDTLYLGGSIHGIGLRAPGLAAFDTGDGQLDEQVAELTGRDADSVAAARTVVADGNGGVYVVGLDGSGASGVRQSGLLHLRADGSVDVAFRPRFQDGAGEASVDVRDAALGPDGTLYVAGGFAQAGGEPRDGLAALDVATGAPKAWNPQLGGAGGADAVVDNVEVVGAQVLASGSFNSVGGQARDGLGGIARADATATAWAPPALSAASAEVALLTDGDAAILVAARAVRSVTTSGSGTVTDLPVAADGDIKAAATTGGRLYAAGLFTQIGGSARDGLAELDLATGSASAWNPGQAGTTQGVALAVDAERVYVALPDATTQEQAWGGALRCGLAAVSRSTGAVAAWDPRLGSDGACNRPPRGLAVSGGKVWAAGGFTTANIARRSGLAAVDLRTDRILPWAPNAGATNARVQGLAVSPDGATVYGVGNMTAGLNGQPRIGGWAVAASGTASSAADVRAWDPNISGIVRDVALEPTAAGDAVRRVYLGGAFTQIDGDAAYTRLAAVEPDSGDAITSFRPAPSGVVNDIELASDGALYVAGDFATIGRTPAARRYLAAFAAGSDEVTAGWDAQVGGDVAGKVFDLALGADAVYAVGTFDGTIGGQTRQYAVALRRADGALLPAWAPAPDGGVVTATAGADGTVYLVGGNGTSGSGFGSLGDQPRPAGVGSVLGGAVTGWAPQTSQFRPVATQWGEDVREVAGKSVVVGLRLQVDGIDGLPQEGIYVYDDAVAPAVLERPSISGSPREGEQLRCQPGSYGSEPVSLAYQWRRDGQPIDGASATTYLVQADDRGTAISCRETAENAAGSVSATSDELTIAVIRAVNRELPAVSGEVKVGVPALCARGAWSDFPTSYRYRWLIDGAAVGGATEQRYTPVAGDANRQLSCEVVAVNAAGDSAPAGSAARAVTPGDTPPPTCEQLGTCPRPTCEQLGTCPRPTCQQLGTCPRPTCQQLGTCPPPPCTVGCGGPPQKVDPPSNRITVTAGKASARKLPFRVRVAAAGALRVVATARLPGARRALQLGSARASAKGAGDLAVDVVLGRAASRALARARSLRVTVRFTFTPAGGTAATIVRTVTIRAAKAKGRGGRK
ncbi:hypothetical protein VSS74_17120 [Conexibacter stalactiti]|uniref:Ig-like domain-containing protein n=1 Tax=Conexibacter stalactiti TaxID=1940611 RepID=A0ABU4HRW6_9ACTN|nr:hypothetical protein [Conexibacter stalactiti]MDW5596071.1 hypothetical protein [Conexibacter stalactiti]MEC5036713.1 hypothetical protein [Conexibacter stalactiti]